MKPTCVVGSTSIKEVIQIDDKCNTTICIGAKTHSVSPQTGLWYA